MDTSHEEIIKILKFQACNHDQNAIDALEVIHDQQRQIEIYKVKENANQQSITMNDQKYLAVFESVAVLSSPKDSILTKRNEAIQAVVDAVRNDENSKISETIKTLREIADANKHIATLERYDQHRLKQALINAMDVINPTPYARDDWYLEALALIEDDS